MAIALNSNIPSTQAQRRLNVSTQDLRQSFERLSSGLRVNHAKDDAAGLAVSEILKTDTRVYTQSILNFNDGMSLLSVADSALESLTEIVTRVKELAQSASNGTLGVAQRGALDAEAQSLSEEYSRIVESTKFNNLNLFSATFGTLRLQGGYGANGAIQSTLGGAVGLGTFNAGSTTYAAESSASSAIALGDLNGDGFTDLVTAGNAGGGKATIRLGTGTGVFGAATQYTTDVTASADLALGDLNGDGILDLLTTGLSGTDSSVTVRIGNGDGTFRASSSFTLLTTSSAPSGLALADLNRDGNLDLSVLVTNGATPKLMYYYGQGNGTFGAVNSISGVPGTPGGLAVADTNQDGFLDIAANIGPSVYIINGTASGFAGLSNYNTFLTNSDDVAFADLNEDGITDMIASGTQISAKIAVRLGQGSGTFGASTSYTMAGSSALDIALGDFNGDGHIDIATGSNTGFSAAIRLGNGDGTFGAITSYSTGGGGGTASIAVADLNSDGVLDLAAAGTDGAGTAYVRLASVTTGVSPLLTVNLTTRASALQAIGPLDQKLSQLTIQRGVVGAYQSRVETAVNNLTIARENFVTATSQITDVDTAEEAAKLVRGKILQQAGVAVLAQANSQPKIALDLLKESSKQK